jgi:nucleotide-binding universal stress UspA family protein
MGMYYKILLGSDGSEAAGRACREVARIAAGTEAEVIVASVASERDPITSSWSGDFENHAVPAEVAAGWAEGEADLLRGGGVNAKARVLEGHPAEALAKEAGGGGYDLLVVGHRGRGESGAPRMGSVAAKLAENASGCPLLIVP